MNSRVSSMGIQGIRGYEVQVECFISGGLPGFDIVGLPDAAVRESRERVRAAIKSSGFPFPPSRITLNLAPAGTKKTGTLYDLPILLCILSSTGAIQLPEDAVFIGELSLEGKVRAVPGVLPMALAARDAGFRKIFVPADNAAEASLADGMTVYPVESIRQLAEHLNGLGAIEPQKPSDLSAQAEPLPDFRDVMGQQNAKRALEIAAAGGHNVLLVGPPGSGKSMLSKRIPSILPDMSREEALEVSKIYSIMGLLSKDRPLVQTRPFRSPHHTVSPAALAGGGPNLRPGEISMAHKGVLFLDELPEFHTDTLEVLRQPLEDQEVTISRATGSVTFPSEFMMVCAMNPCKCGWYGVPGGRCTCSQKAVDSYLGRISGPLLDRVDMIVEVPSVEFDDLRTREPAEPSCEIRKRVNAARQLQEQRQGAAMPNARLAGDHMRTSCHLSDECAELMQMAFTSLRLTARSYDRILRVARTIADLAGSETILPEHIAEAIQYRTYQFGRD